MRIIVVRMLAYAVVSIFVERSISIDSAAYETKIRFVLHGFIADRITPKRMSTRTSLVSLDASVLCERQKSRTGILGVLRTSKCACIYLQKPPSKITPNRPIKNNLTVLLKIRNTPTAINVSRGTPEPF